MQKPRLEGLTPEEKEQDFIDSVLRNSEFVCPYANGIHKTSFVHAPPFIEGSRRLFRECLQKSILEFSRNAEKEHLAIFLNNQPDTHEDARLFFTKLFIELCVAAALPKSKNRKMLRAAYKEFQQGYEAELNDPRKTIGTPIVDLQNGNQLYVFAMGPLFPNISQQNPHPRYLESHALIITKGEKVAKVPLTNPGENQNIALDNAVRIAFSVLPHLDQKAGRHLIIPSKKNQEPAGLTTDVPQIIKDYLAYSKVAELGLYPEPIYVEVLEPMPEDASADSLVYQPSEKEVLLELWLMIKEDFKAWFEKLKTYTKL